MQFIKKKKNTSTAFYHECLWGETALHTSRLCFLSKAQIHSMHSEAMTTDFSPPFEIQPFRKPTLTLFLDPGDVVVYL